MIFQVYTISSVDTHYFINTMHNKYVAVKTVMQKMCIEIKIQYGDIKKGYYAILHGLR